MRHVLVQVRARGGEELDVPGGKYGSAVGHTNEKSDGYKLVVLGEAALLPGYAWTQQLLTHRVPMSCLSLLRAMLASWGVLNWTRAMPVGRPPSVHMCTLRRSNRIVEDVPQAHGKQPTRSRIWEDEGAQCHHLLLP